jgi:hypothetical protein
MVAGKNPATPRNFSFTYTVFTEDIGRSVFLL